MKKLFALILILILITALTACKDKSVLQDESNSEQESGNQEIMDFKPSDVMNIEVYDIHGGANGERKIVTEEKDIKVIIDTLLTLTIIGDGANAETMYGGAIQFVFHKADNSQFALSHDGNTLLTSDGNYYEVKTKSNLFDLWSKLKYDVQSIPEYELPFYPKDRVPILGLRYTHRGELYNDGTLLGTYSWCYENADGTETCVDSDSTHPLDNNSQPDIITKMDDMNKIELVFSMPPSSYTVKRWPDTFIGNIVDNVQNAEIVNVVDSAIVLSNEDKGYIYEVYATWLQGNAYYSFYIN